MDLFFSGLDNIFASGSAEDVDKYLKDSLAKADAEGDRHAAAAILNEVTGFNRNVSNYAESLKAAERAVALMLELGYENTIPYGTTLLNAATAFRAAGDDAKALELFLASLAAFGKQLPEDDHRFAGLFNNISAIYKDSGKYEEALDALQKAVSIMDKNPDMVSDAATVRTNLALVLFELGREAEALETLENALAMFKRAGMRGAADIPAPHYAAALAGMGEACHRMGRYGEALESYESALEHLRGSFGENRDYAVICGNCAAVCEAAGNPDKAAAYMTRAGEIFARLGIEV